MPKAAPSPAAALAPDGAVAATVTRPAIASTAATTNTLIANQNAASANATPLSQDLPGLTEDTDFLAVGYYGLEGTGKGHPINTPVLTLDGWRPIGSLRPADSVIGANGQPTQVEAVYPRGTQPVYRVAFNDGSEVICDGDHLWQVSAVSGRRRGIPEVVSVDALRQRTLMNKIDPRAPAGVGSSRYRIPIVEPIAYPKRTDLELDPYLLGMLLANGALGKTPEITTNDREIITRISDRNPHLGTVRHREIVSVHHWRFVGLGTPIAALGLTGSKAANKHVPDKYLRAGLQQRLDLLRGLMDCDGSCVRRTGHGGAVTQYHTQSGRLARAIVDLVQGLGGTARIHSYPSRASTFVHPTKTYDYEAGRATDHAVTLVLPAWAEPFYLSRKREIWQSVAHRPPNRLLRSIEPAGHAETVCIKVAASDGLFVTQDHLVTHNTANLLAMAKLGPVLLINAESGAKPRALQRLGITTENFRIWPNPKKGERITFDGFEQLYFRTKAELVRDRTSWTGIALDSITEIIRLLISDERNRQWTRALARGRERERFFTDRDDYQAVTAQVSEKLRQFRDLPCHFGFTALERRDDDGIYGPAANPALASDLPGFVDLLVHCQTQEIGDNGDDVFLGWTKKHEKYRAKDRYGWLPKAVPTPQFDRLLGYVRGELDPATDPILTEVIRRREGLAAAEAGKEADA